jgi:hypothetical protein
MMRLSRDEAFLIAVNIAKLPSADCWLHRVRRGRYPTDQRRERSSGRMGAAYAMGAGNQM